MIEKLDILKHTDNLYGKDGFIANIPRGKDVIIKINEVVDIVNSIVSVQEKLIDSRFVVETKHDDSEKANCQVNVQKEALIMALEALHTIAHWGPGKDDREEYAEKAYKKICELLSKVDDRMIGCTTLDIPKSYKTDPYAEQRKWIGKLCKFQDIADDEYLYEILTAIDDRDGYPYKAGDISFSICEPVSEDLIYKGE